MAKTLAPTFAAPDSLPENTRSHLKTVTLNVTKTDASKVKLPCYNVKSSYLVQDAYTRTMGLVVSANYAPKDQPAEKRVTWFAILPDGNVSTNVLLSQEEAIRTLEVMYAGFLLCGGIMDKATAPELYASR